VTPWLIETTYRGSLSLEGSVALVVYAEGRHRAERHRREVAMLAWILPWRGGTGLAQGIGRVAGRFPLIRFAWAFRGVIGVVAVVPQVDGGRPALGILAGSIVALTYLVTAANDATARRVEIGNPEPGLGILAAAGATWRLVELVGEPVAKRILLAGQILDATSAAAVNLLDEIVDSDELIAAGHRWADRITKQAPMAVRLTKAVFHAPREAHPFVDDLAQAVLFETADKHERMTAFLERKKK